MFDVTKSKLYSQIMEGFVSFFGMGADATESEIHARIESEKPLSEQLEAAKNDGAATAANDIAELKSRMSEMETKLNAQANDIESKVARISELETEITAAKEAATTAQSTLTEKVKEYEAKVLELSGEVARSKAGKLKEQSSGDGQHDASKIGASNSGQPIAVVSSDLQKLLKKQSN